MGVVTFDGGPWTAELVARRKAGATVSVCIPCRNEEATIGPIVRSIRTALMDDHEVVDELIVLDDRSIDGTAAVAAAAGAQVVPIESVHRRFGEGSGKGNALWSSLVASTGDLIVWCDGDVRSFSPTWVVRLLAPLLNDDDIALVKAMYHRPTDEGGGGRTTELVARPLLSLFAPDLAVVEQPLSGEVAARRSVLVELPFPEGWGVEIGLLLDVARHHGAHAIAQVDLGVRRHRHQSLRDLSRQAAEVMATVLARTPSASSMTDPATLMRPDGPGEPLNLRVRPPLSALLAAGTSPVAGPR